MSSDRIVRFCTAGPALYVAGFVWGFAEAVWFFVVPDVLLTFAAIHAPRRAAIATVWAVLGAVLGGAIMYAFGTYDSELAVRWLDSVPLVSPGIVATATDQLREFGVNGMGIGLAHGIPYKTYAVLSGERQIEFAAFLFMSVVARLLRMISTVIVAYAIAWIIRRFAPSFARFLPLVWAVAWIVFYALYVRSMLA